MSRKRKYNIYDLSNDYGIGYTSNTNNPFYFDLEDYDKIKDYCWHETEDGYVATRIGNKAHFMMHRLIVRCDNSVDIDHIHHNGMDNRKNNIRICTRQQNNRNKRKTDKNTSGVVGVCWHKRNRKWQASIMVNKKNIYLGLYENINDAIKARKEAEIKYFGEFRYKGE